MHNQGNESLGGKNKTNISEGCMQESGTSIHKIIMSPIESAKAWSETSPREFSTALPINTGTCPNTEDKREKKLTEKIKSTLFARQR